MPHNHMVAAGRLRLGHVGKCGRLHREVYRRKVPQKTDRLVNTRIKVFTR